MKRTLITIAAMAMLAACGGDTDAPQQADAPAPADASTGTDAVTGGDYVPLTRESVTRWVNAMLASITLAERNPQLADALGADGDESAEEVIAEIRKHPEVVSMLRREGFTPEQYVGMMQTMIGAMLAQGFVESGQLTERPAHVREADMRFIAENKEWFEREWSRIDAAGPQSGNDDDIEDEDE